MADDRVVASPVEAERPYPLGTRGQDIPTDDRYQRTVELADREWREARQDIDRMRSALSDLERYSRLMIDAYVQDKSMRSKDYAAKKYAKATAKACIALDGAS